jgi:hypothetical protein
MLYMNKKYNTEIFIKKAKQVHGNLYNYSLVEYQKSNLKVKIICPVHGVFEQTPASHLTGRKCNKCQTIKVHAKQKKTTDKFIEECIKKFGKERFDYSETKYFGAHKTIKVKCKKHGCFFVIARVHYINDGCCPKCKKEKLYNLFADTKEGFIKKAEKLHGDNYDYDLVEYFNAAKKIKIKCKKHNYVFEATPNNHLRGKGCPKCKASKGELKIRNFLLKEKINFSEQRKFYGCEHKNSLIFDFYLIDKNLLIEYQGEQHYMYCNQFHNHNKKSLQHQQVKDQIKWQYAKDNNIKFLEIAYWDYENIESILKKELNL